MPLNWKLLGLAFIPLLCISCGLRFTLDDTGDSSTTLPAPSTTPIIEATSRYVLALGGVAPGRDELVIIDDNLTIRNFTGQTLAITSGNPLTVSLETRVGYEDYASGSGALLIPHKAGATLINYFVDGQQADDQYAVIIPPQELIRILLGEALIQIYDETTIVDGTVPLSSKSFTATALGAVIRNRIALINITSNPALFLANSTLFYSNPPESAYRAIIDAHSGSTYQFSPVDPNDLTHELFLDAALRNQLYSTEQLVYDQAVITAAGIFDGTLADPTQGSFAFRSPTAEQLECIETTAESASTFIPVECGPGDENFPTLAPVQILLDRKIGLQDDGRAAFIFYRQRLASDPAVIIIP